MDFSIKSGKSDASVILAPDGAPAMVPTVQLSDEDAALLRAYKKFLQAQGLREALYCNNCWNGQREDGTQAHVTGDEIVILCRCRNRYYRGMTF